MPLYPELRPHLEAVRDELLADFDPKRKRLSEQPVITRYRDANANLRTQLCKIIRWAAPKPWPKLFQNLRATRATELADEYPAHVAASWLGHSNMIAEKHYRQTTNEHFAKAVCRPFAQQNAQQNTPQNKGTEENTAEQECENPGDLPHGPWGRSPGFLIIVGVRLCLNWATRDSNQ